MAWSGPPAASAAFTSNTETVISSLVVPHTPLSMVQIKVVLPKSTPVTTVLGLDGSTTVPLPAMLQKPMAGCVAALANMSTSSAPGSQNCWSGPASASACVLSYMVTTTVSVIAGPQGPFRRVQTSTVSPGSRPERVAFAAVGSLSVPAPLSMVHSPVAGALTGVAFIGVLVTGAQCSWSGPAFAVEMLPSNRVTNTWSTSVPQGPLSTVQAYSFTPGPMAVTSVAGSVASVKVPLPLTTLHCPVAG